MTKQNKLTKVNPDSARHARSGGLDVGWTGRPDSRWRQTQPGDRGDQAVQFGPSCLRSLRERSSSNKTNKPRCWFIPGGPRSFPFYIHG